MSFKRNITFNLINFFMEGIVANIKSQEKRILISNKERMQNKSKKTRVATEIKKFRQALSEKDLKKAEELLRECISLIDSARLDGVYHKNWASRKVSTLMKEFNTAKAE